jgi:hypothetical protein
VLGSNSVGQNIGDIIDSFNASTETFNNAVDGSSWSIAILSTIKHDPLKFEVVFTSMSGHWDRHGDSDKELATTFQDQRNFQGKGHDRIHGDNPIPGASSTIAMTRDNEDVEVDITAGQKMLSAMSGSLLTSLLGQ